MLFATLSTIWVEKENSYLTHKYCIKYIGTYLDYCYCSYMEPFELHVNLFIYVYVLNFYTAHLNWLPFQDWCWMRSRQAFMTWSTWACGFSHSAGFLRMLPCLLAWLLDSAVCSVYCWWSPHEDNTLLMRMVKWLALCFNRAEASSDWLARTTYKPPGRLLNVFFGLPKFKSGSCWPL